MGHRELGRGPVCEAHHLPAVLCLPRGRTRLRMLDVNVNGCDAGISSVTRQNGWPHIKSGLRLESPAFGRVTARGDGRHSSSKASAKEACGGSLGGET